MEVVIIGGVAGGVSVATRLRRLMGDANITVYEKGGYISYANCGMPYHLSSVIPRRESLLLQTPTNMKNTFNVDVKVGAEVVKIDPQKKVVHVREGENTFEKAYDKLIISTGAKGRDTGIVGIEDFPNVAFLRDMGDLDKIKGFMSAATRKKALIIGSGFIGLEVLENLHEADFDVTLVEFAPKVLPVLDPAFSTYIEKYIKEKGITVVTGAKVDSFDKASGEFKFSNGNSGSYDFVVAAAGNVPNSGLAKDCGIELNERGYIKVDRETMLTSIPDIYASGDVSEIYNAITGKSMPLALAWHAKRQSRIIADHIARENGIDIKEQEFGGFVGTGITKIFDLVVAKTGLTLQDAEREGIDAVAIVEHGMTNAGYYPGATRISIKLVYEKDSGAILGACIMGKTGVDKRIDAVALAIKNNMTVYDLADMEFAYAPPFNGPKDPLNMIGYIASNIADGTSVMTTVDDIEMWRAKGAVLLDVRNDPEIAASAIEGITHIPLPELYARHGEIPKDKPIIVICAIGQRAHTGQCVLRGLGFGETYNLNGGMTSYDMFIR